MQAEVIDAETVPEPETPKTALARKESAALAKPTTSRAIVMADALKEASEQRAILKEYVEHHMIEGVDYGKIPGTDKPTLLKPGAEKLTDLFRCTAKFDLMEKVEDWDKGLFHYMFHVKITLRDSDIVVAEGVGSANSKEGKWRWRNADRKCPACGVGAIIKGKAEYGGGWICFKKKQGCGAKFEDDDAEIVDQPTGKVENDDIFTLTNTILKIAKKRAHVDGAIALGRCSDLFTQDVEELADHGPVSLDEKRAYAKKEFSDARRISKDMKAEKTERTARARKVWDDAKNNGITEAGFPAWVTEILGSAKRSTAWTEEDMEKLEKALEIKF